MEQIEVSRIGIAQLAQLQSIGKKTFQETFAVGNTEANMQAYLTKDFAIEKLTRELTDPNAEFYFATLGGEVIGYLKLNRGQAQTELQDKYALEIERIYVLQQYHGKRVGQALYDKAIEVAILYKASYVWLGVWEENKRAISFYQKNGFVAFDKHIFKLGDDEQIDIMMKLELKD